MGQATADLRIVTTVLLLLWGLFPPRNSYPSEALTICQPGSYTTLSRLFDYCGLPAECGGTLRCEGKTAVVKGSIDYDNVFEKRSSPQLPYEKFFLRGGSGQVVEVLATATNNKALFDKIFMARKDGKEEVYVTGIIRGIDQPIMGTCRRGIRLESDSPDDIEFR